MPILRKIWCFLFTSSTREFYPIKVPTFSRQLIVFNSQFLFLFCHVRAKLKKMLHHVTLNVPLPVDMSLLNHVNKMFVVFTVSGNKP